MRAGKDLGEFSSVCLAEAELCIFYWSYFKSKGLFPKVFLGDSLQLVLSRLLKQMNTVKAMTGKPIKLLVWKHEV